MYSCYAYNVKYMFILEAIKTLIHQHETSDGSGCVIFNISHSFLLYNVKNVNLDIAWFHSSQFSILLQSDWACFYHCHLYPLQATILDL